MNKIHISASGGYDVLIERGILKEAGKYICDVIDERNRRVLVITDDNVDPLYSKSLTDSFEKYGITSEKIVIKNGEESKNINNYIMILQHLADDNFCRSNAVVALGGGVVGDLAGFAAATYERGMVLIQIPTTVLAAVDSSVGGKTAINLEPGAGSIEQGFHKNMVGAFYQPKLVLCDPECFATLPKNIVRDGCAEIVKYGILANRSLYETVVTCVCDEEPLDDDIIAKCVSIKKHYVEGDEFDRGMRQYLNLGHTIGHAIESVSDYKVTHGEAVALGTVIATRIALKIGVCEEECPLEVIEGIRSMGFDLSLNYSSEALIEAIAHDKKRSGDGINMILPRCIGECTVHTFRTGELKELLEDLLT